MIKRLAVVFWWVGFLAGAAVIAANFIAASFIIGAAMGGGIFLAGCALSFILGGSFWTPPKS